jgi:hypothetical protein
MDQYLQNIHDSYLEHQRMAEHYKDKDASQQHAAHLVMQRLVDDRNAYLASLSQQPAPGGGGGGSAPPPPPPPPTPPDPWIRTSDYVAPEGVKQADPDIVLFNDEAISPELLLQLQYEDVAGIELINISRSDIIDGQNVSYSPIAQLSSLRRRYNPNNIIALPSTSSDAFSRFGIDLILRGIKEPYFNENGDLVIEIDEVLEDEIIEAEIDTSGTINRVDFS